MEYINGRLFVGGLSPRTTLKSLAAYFGRYGNLVDCDIKLNTLTGKSRCFGFMTYAVPENADRVLSEGPHNLDGRKIHPKPCRKRLKKNKHGGLPQQNVKAKRKQTKTSDEPRLQNVSRVIPIAMVDLTTGKKYWYVDPVKYYGYGFETDKAIQGGSTKAKDPKGLATQQSTLAGPQQAPGCGGQAACTGATTQNKSDVLVGAVGGLTKAGPMAAGVPKSKARSRFMPKKPKVAQQSDGYKISQATSTGAPPGPAGSGTDLPNVANAVGPTSTSTTAGSLGGLMAGMPQQTQGPNQLSVQMSNVPGLEQGLAHKKSNHAIYTVVLNAPPQGSTAYSNTMTANKGGLTSASRAAAVNALAKKSKQAAWPKQLSLKCTNTTGPQQVQGYGGYNDCPTDASGASLGAPMPGMLKRTAGPGQLPMQYSNAPGPQQVQGYGGYNINQTNYTGAQCAAFGGGASNFPNIAPKAGVPTSASGTAAVIDTGKTSFVPAGMLTWTPGPTQLPMQCSNTPGSQQTQGHGDYKINQAIYTGTPYAVPAGGIAYLPNMTMNAGGPIVVPQPMVCMPNWTPGSTQAPLQLPNTTGSQPFYGYGGYNTPPGGNAYVPGHLPLQWSNASVPQQVHGDGGYKPSQGMYFDAPNAPHAGGFTVYFPNMPINADGPNYVSGPAAANSGVNAGLPQWTPGPQQVQVYGNYKMNQPGGGSFNFPTMPTNTGGVTGADSSIAQTQAAMSCK